MKKLDATVLAAILAPTIIGAAIFVTTTMKLQPVYAIPPVPCDACAKEFAPGQEAENPGGAEDLAPGHVDDNSPELEPRDDAPGKLKQKDILR